MGGQGHVGVLLEPQELANQKDGLLLHSHPAVGGLATTRLGASHAGHYYHYVVRPEDWINHGKGGSRAPPYGTPSGRRGLTGDAPQGARLALMVGLPRSGKSTYARALQETGWTRIEPDAFRLALHGHAFHSPAEGKVWAAAELAVRALLIGGHAVVIDATNTTRHRRAGWLRIARDLGAPAEAFVVDTTLEECLERNEGRRHRVPVEVMERMARRFERPDPELEDLEVRNITDGTGKERS